MHVERKQVTRKKIVSRDSDEIIEVLEAMDEVNFFEIEPIFFHQYGRPKLMNFLKMQQFFLQCALNDIFLS